MKDNIIDILKNFNFDVNTLDSIASVYTAYSVLKKMQTLYSDVANYLSEHIVNDALKESLETKYKNLSEDFIEECLQQKAYLGNYIPLDDITNMNIEIDRYSPLRFAYGICWQNEDSKEKYSDEQQAFYASLCGVEFDYKYKKSGWWPAWKYIGYSDNVAQTIAEDFLAIYEKYQNTFIHKR
ncbi:MAG: hypothetical protein ACRCV3_00565 [Desulfovibrionaceae bacterium]